MGEKSSTNETEKRKKSKSNSSKEKKKKRRVEDTRTQDATESLSLVREASTALINALTDSATLHLPTSSTAPSLDSLSPAFLSEDPVTSAAAVLSSYSNPDMHSLHQTENGASTPGTIVTDQTVSESPEEAAFVLQKFLEEAQNGSKDIAELLSSFPDILNQPSFVDLTPEEQHLLLQTIAQEAELLAGSAQSSNLGTHEGLIESRAANPKRRLIESVQYQRNRLAAQIASVSSLMRNSSASSRSTTPLSQSQQNPSTGASPSSVQRPETPKPAVFIPAVDVVDDDRTLSKMYRSRRNKDDIGLERNTYNKGPFSRLERQKIEEAVIAYIEERSIPRQDIHLLVNRKSRVGSGSGVHEPNPNPYSTKEYAGFIAAVREHSAVNRSLDQIYWYLSRAYSAIRTEGRRWTPEDDAVLLALVAQKGRKWKEIEQEMGMTDTRSRYQKLTRGTSGIRTGKWTPEEESSLIETVRHLMAEKGITNPTQFNSWKEVALRVRTRTDHQCRTKWTGDIIFRIDGNEIRSETRKWRYEDDADLLTRLMTDCATANDETEILWEALIPEGKTWTGPFLRTQWLKLRSKIPDIESLSFQDAVQYAITHLDEITTGLSRDDLVHSEDEND